MNYIDIFAGVSGLSEGFYRAGFNPIAHVEMDANAALTIKTRVAYHHYAATEPSIYNDYLLGKLTREELYSNVPTEKLDSVIQEEITEEKLKSLFKHIDKLRDGRKIDLLLGGPPCQAYSLVGRSRMGTENVVNDKRYHLYKLYGQFLLKYKPKFFVFENVLGLLSAENGKMLETIKNHLRECGYVIQHAVLNAADYGVLQNRKRVIIIGKRGKKNFDFPLPEKETPIWTIQNDLFYDLPKLQQGQAISLGEYTLDGKEYLVNKQLRNGLGRVIQHITRPHNNRDLEIYALAINKWLNYGERLKYNELPSRLKTHQNEHAFLDRYKVVDPNGVSHTVVAHLAKDGHYFIYPDADNPRSISVREAARIQSFPDNFYFEGGRSAAFKQIGNAVPPILAERVANSIKINI